MRYRYNKILPSFLTAVVAQASVEDFTDTQYPKHDLQLFRNSNYSQSFLGTSCSALLSCSDCYKSSFCHWCEADNACHVRGSFYGCISGSTCTHEDKKNDTDDHSCYTQSSCSECVKSSRFCHWCAHDNSCHAIGSPYGCVSGVDCYSNDRCKREVPEKVAVEAFQKVNNWFLLFVCTAALILIGCASACFGCFVHRKAIHDYIVQEEPWETNVDDLQEPLLPEDEHIGEEEAVEAEAHGLESVQECSEEGHSGEDDEEQQQHHESVQIEDLVDDEQRDAMDSDEVGQDEGGHDDDGEGEQHEYTTLVETNSVSTTEDGEELGRHIAGSGGKMYDLCLGCYLVAVISTLLFLVASLMYYPRIPIYNVCNDAIAWKELIESLVRSSVNAEIEILLSVANPNVFNAALDVGKGNFTHNGNPVGNFVIPPVNIGADSITDLFIIATLSPRTWEALSLTNDYYRGKLILGVETEATIRVPCLFNYSYTANLPHIEVHVNVSGDRHLCACPTWNRNQSATVLKGHTDAVDMLAF